MRLKRKLKSSLALLILISFAPSTLWAQTSPADKGRFTILEKDAPVPFRAWCFDELATAKLVTSLEFAKKECHGQVDIALRKQKAHYDLLIGNLNLRIDIMTKEQSEILQVKNKEIESLTAAAIKRPNDYSHWWATGGFVVGAASVIGVVILAR